MLLKKIVEYAVNRVVKWFEKDYSEVHFMGGDVLPQALTPQEEDELIKRLEAGDIAVRQTLIERNLRLVAYIARKFENTGVGLEDLISIGTIGLIKAVNTFCPNKNIKLATYASRCIENEVLMHLRKSVKIKAEISLDEPLNTDWDGNELVLSDLLGTDSDMIFKDLEKNLERELLLEAVKRLNKREQEIMDMRFGLGGKEVFTQKEVADILGISQSYISRLEKRIIRRLRDELQKLA